MKIKGMTFNLLFALLSLLTVIKFYQNSFLTFIGLLIIAVMGLTFWRSKTTYLIFIFGAVLGTISEIIAIKQGVWNYAVSNFQGVPYWLLILWGNASAFIYQIALDIDKITK